jgi:hypothetical protein
MKYLRDNFEGEEYEFRKAQILRGLNKGREELLKMISLNYMKAPIILLVLTHHTHGPPFLRALITVLRNRNDDNPDDPLIFPDSSAHERRLVSPEERMWGVKLNQDSDDVVHYWRQFGLNRECCTADLKKLSEMTTPRTKGLPVFKEEFPVLFECLHAVFGLMMSNSRLCEQIHGMLRQRLRSSGPGMDQVDAQQSYIISEDYEMKTERRGMIGGERRAEQPPKKKLKADEHSKTKSQLRKICDQLLSRASVWRKRSEALLSQPNHGILTVKQTQSAGRMVQDKHNIEAEIAAHKKRAKKLKRDKITIDRVMEDATSVEPTNDRVLRLGMKD